MFKITVLILTLCLQTCICRRPSNTLDNDINSSSNGVFVRPKDWVKISVPPSPVISRSIGARIEFECEATGSPAPTIQWLKGNRPLTENESFETNALNELPTSGMAKVRSKIIIPSTLFIHEDVYTCLAQSGSKIATATTRLYIQRSGTFERNITQILSEELLGGRQPARIVLYDVIYMGNIGTNIVLPCKTAGNPRPSVVWLDSSEQVMENGSDLRVTVHPNGDLRIRNIHWGDMGPYTCVARNDLAEESITTFLYPMLATK